MKPLHYEPLENTSWLAKWSKRILLGFLGVIFVVVITTAIYIGWWSFEIRQAIGVFNAKTSNSKVVGKTAKDLAAFLGPPNDSIIDSDGILELTYYGPYGSYCRMNLRKGVVETVNRWSQ